MKKVFIVGNDWSIQSMFQARGWGVAKVAAEADLIQFTGGEDVTPQYYGEQQHPQTYCNSNRDAQESEIFDLAIDIPKAGICRGGQFLNVMNGGKMYQHVDNHALGGTHQVLDLFSHDAYQATSTHHQMMREGPSGLIIAIADNLSTFKEYMRDDKIARVKDPVDVEVVYYPETNSLCFQPHPEYNNALECREHYFRYIEDYLFNGEI